jgi:hypothetical protein
MPEMPSMSLNSGVGAGNKLMMGGKKTCKTYCKTSLLRKSTKRWLL